MFGAIVNVSPVFNSFLNYMIQNKPMVIVDYITKFLGFFLNLFYEFTYLMTVNNSLGISIIFLTIFSRILMLPMAIKQQKSMEAMQKIQPLVEKIKKKYGDSKDPEIQRKMNTEIQSLYTKNKVNPLGGCLPAFFQLPIFFALNYIIRECYMFINKLGDIYMQLAEKVMEIPGYVDILVDYNYALPKVPKGMTIKINEIMDLRLLLAKFSPEEWTSFFKLIPTENVESISTVFQQKMNIETFFGINLIGPSGTSFPGILIPILAALTTFLSSYLMNKNQKTADEKAKMQQSMMLIVMPVMMGFMTINLTAGVGVYWVTSYIFQLVQQIVLNKQYALIKDFVKRKLKRGTVS